MSAASLKIVKIEFFVLKTRSLIYGAACIAMSKINNPYNFHHSAKSPSAESVHALVLI